MTESAPVLRTILDLLEIRGCRTEFQPQALGRGRGAWVIFYPEHVMLGEVLPQAFRSRMIYPDERGEKQAMELLKELNAGYAPSNLITPETMAAEALEELKKAFTYDS